MSNLVKWMGAVLVLIGMVGCGAPATVEPTVQPSTDPQPPALLGYVGDPPDSPAVFLKVAQGMAIEISQATYDPLTSRLTSYQAKISYPSGDQLEMEFRDIGWDAVGSVTGYRVKSGEAIREGPPPDVFASQFSGALGERRMVAFAPAWETGRPEPGYRIFICPGIMSINYDIFDGHEMVTRQEIACEGEQDIYAFDFDDYTFDKDATLTGFSVGLEVAPNVQ